MGIDNFELDAVIVEGRVLDNIPLSADTSLMTVTCPEVARLASPGRFVKVRAWPGLEDDQGPLLDRPFSIHRAQGDQLSLLYRVVGPATRLMSYMPAGAPLQISGPLGRGLAGLTDRTAGLYLAAGGIGLAPMALARDWLGLNEKVCSGKSLLPDDNLRPDLSSAGHGPVRGPAALFYGERNGAAQVEENWLKSWAGDYLAVTEDGSGYGGRGLVTGPLEEALAREVRPVFACGPNSMLAAVSRLGAEYGAPVWTSVEAGMACGFGVCLTCSLPLKGGGRFRVCREGPVVDGLSVDWEMIR